MRLPVAEKIALANAGAAGGTVGSPMPLTSSESSSAFTTRAGNSELVAQHPEQRHFGLDVQLVRLAAPSQFHAQVLRRSRLDCASGASMLHWHEGVENSDRQLTSRDFALS